ncbi:sugar transporter [Auricularia subglabra TFB-10046 SS5]|uniref:Sugar transporter n=1 Tax=Auricularia subglabra (strain TFB-10046 / SS5) TaxID=717982 RepID=J0LEN8_AURST|nr:sugar transporter [Auricularia subglabra TFB-10046 SS5]
MALLQNIRVYYLAIIVYFGIVLFGYDTGIAGGVVAQKAFEHQFLGLNATQSHKDAVSQNVVSVLQAGAFFGALGSTVVSTALGRKMTLLAFSLLFSLGAILQTVAGPGRGLGYIYSGRVIAGIGVGAISAVAPTFVSECAPKDVRGRITGFFQIMVAIGVMLSYFTNYGVSAHIKEGPKVWRIAFGLQLVPAGIMCVGLLVCKESPRWLASKGRMQEALTNLAYLRKLPTDHESVRSELAEIEASIEEEREARTGLGWKEAFLGKGNWPRFLIAFVIFVLQQFSGQNTVNYYAPQIFEAIGYTGTTPSLLASGVYGIVKVVATAIFIFFGVESLGRVWSLRISGFGMGALFFMIGAILKTHPPAVSADGAIPPASRAMAGLLYIYVCFYSMGWGPVPWVYVSDIFSTRTRAYGMGWASATQWLFNFVVSQISLTIKRELGWKLFLLFGTINIGGMVTFTFFIPETKGRSLEEMDVVFGSVTAEKREQDIARAERALGGGAHAEEENEKSSEKQDERV